MKSTAMIVQRDPLLSQDLQEAFGELGIEVVAVSRDADAAARDAVTHLQPRYIVLDAGLVAGGDGLTLAHYARHHLPEVKLILVTGSEDEDAVKGLRAAAPLGVLRKPVLSVELERLIMNDWKGPPAEAGALARK
ncbi:response regulator [Tranquillimonas alkanivorans]|uniref:CheY chemotaxis protein or a CheY-like REC (Receiver) domain n=1 Tax=Tranquillimonas alkanivorans TaxID=441119 RepID=A0A1I5WEI7_9RHOB|nr:response regulator [Tranquillimonas alkanivorans]SFQ17796.1 CheY chemotaxis protein or a CheY-like REC (receiver) domain [Tranquillimonas alkanivorans]